jgi:3-oxoacyl-(acyl-carrier-protein) synthase
MDGFIHYGLAAGIQAFRDSGIEVTEANAERIGVNIGSGIGGLPMIEERTTISSVAVRARSRPSSFRARSST